MSNKSKFLQFFRVWRKTPLIAKFQLHYAEFLERQSVRMAGGFDGLSHLSLLAIICGLLSGGIIILFRWLIESGLGIFIDNPTVNGFSSLDAHYRFLLVFGGSVLVGALFQYLSPKHRQVGVIHVIERLTYHQGYLPIKNALAQFLGAIIALVSGQSLGREGPGIHLGATSGSVLGRYLKVPNNSTRTLVACGVAAAISAGFNTPLAGVIFAMEVVMMEYSMIGFTPVIVSAVSATTLSRFVFGDSPALAIPPFEWTSIGEITFVALLGIAIGCLSAFFTHSTFSCLQFLLKDPSGNA